MRNTPSRCSVDGTGCGYCIGVPCRWPADQPTPSEDADFNDAENAWEQYHREQRRERASDV